MTPLSIVVATSDGGPGPERCAAALARELCDGDEVVWTGPRDPPGWLRPVRRAAPQFAPRGHLYGAGLAASRHDHVAFTDSNTEVGVGWRSGVSSGLDDHVVVGGPVFPGEQRSLRSWAGFFVEYGPHATRPFRSATGDVSANNVAYRRGDLMAALSSDGHVWKSAVNERLRALGIEPGIVDAMAATSAKEYGWRALSLERVGHGRLFGAQQAMGATHAHRIMASVRCSVLPFVAYMRLAARMLQSARLRRPFVLATPLICVALVAWSAGEASGYATGRKGTHDVY